MTSFSNSNSSNRAAFLFVQTPFDAATKQSVMGRALPSFLVSRNINQKGLMNALLSNKSSRSQSASSYTGRCHSIREAMQHRALQICFLAYTSFKSNVLKLHTAQKVCSVNTVLFLGVLSSPWFTYIYSIIL